MPRCCGVTMEATAFRLAPDVSPPVVIENVPALACPECGEMVVSDGVMGYLECLHRLSLSLSGTGLTSPPTQTDEAATETGLLPAVPDTTETGLA